MIGKLEVIGEWAADGSLEQTDEHRMMNVDELKEAIRQRVYEMDLQMLLAGLLTILGIHREDSETRFSLEVHVPLFMEEVGEYDLSLLDDRAAMLKLLKEHGFYLEGHRDGYVKCYIEGELDDMEKELNFVEEALAQAD